MFIGIATFIDMEKIFICNEDLSKLIFTFLALAFVTFGVLIIESDWSFTFVFSGILILVINYSRVYWFRNHIILSKKHIYIRFASKKGTKIKLLDIKKFDIKYNYLTISTINNDCFVFNIKEISSCELNNFILLLEEELESVNEKQNNY